MSCECIKCGRLHQPLGKPPWALSHDDLMHLSRQFRTDYRTAQDQRINNWLTRLIAEATRPMPEEERGKLEPCPFCGGNASRHDLTEEGNEGGSCIACDQCGASSPVHFDRKENLYDSWNRRSTSERGMREALEKIIDLDHHNHGPASRASEIARAALNPAGPA